MKRRGLGWMMVASSLLGCPSDEDSDASTMCYASDGVTLSLKCYTDSIHSCEEDGMSSLGSYDTHDLCWDDVDDVLDAWRNTQQVTIGPNANERGGGGSSGGGSSGGGGGSYDYSFTCASGTSATLPIPEGDCESQYEQYGRIFGCNEVDSFYSACYSLYSCLVNSEGSAYQQNLDYCASYQ